MSDNSPALDQPPRDRRDAALDIAEKTLAEIARRSVQGQLTAAWMAGLANNALGRIIELRRGGAA